MTDTLRLLCGSDEEFARGLVALGWFRYPPTVTDEPFHGRARLQLNPRWGRAGQVAGTGAWVYRLRLNSERWQDAVAVVESELRQRPHFAVVFCALPGRLLVIAPQDPERAFARRAGISVAPLVLDTAHPANFEEDALRKLKDAPAVGFRRRLQEIVDVERVTASFYREFDREKNAFVAEIQGIPDEDDRRWYASVVLNRLMFLCFIQHRGLLDGDRDYLRVRLQQCEGRRDYYRDFLIPLFFEGLGRRPEERSAETQALLGDVPYLNGGLFLEHPLERKYRGKIAISDRAFRRMLDFFAGYTWHIDDRPLSTARDLNPDVLGYIFEKYINQREMGAYYTKEDITGYICRNTILPRLFDMLAEARGLDGPLPLPVADVEPYIYDAVKKGDDLPLPPEIEAGVADVARRGGWNAPAPEEYALPTETWREVVARRERCRRIRQEFAAGRIATVNDTITYNLDIERIALDFVDGITDAALLHTFYFRCVQRITVLDPTCGSGAFLFAALKILYPLYDACLRKMEALRDAPDAGPVATWKGEFAFANEVDAQPAFLDVDSADDALLADFRAELARIAKHRNREYYIHKCIVVNNLFGVDLMDEAVEICKLRLFLNLISHARPEDPEGIEPLPDIDFNILPGNTLVGYTSVSDVHQLEQRAAGPSEHRTGTLDWGDRDRALQLLLQNYGQQQRMFRDHQLGLPVPRPVSRGDVLTAAKDIRPRLDNALWNLHKRCGLVGARTTQEHFLKTRRPLHWMMEFPAAMAEGFDVVVGNPPYVARATAEKEYRIVGFATGDCPDIYANVVERACQLAAEGGRVAMIVPLSLTFSTEFASLRKLVLSESAASWFSSYDNIPAALFSGVSQRCTIWLAQRGEPEGAGGTWTAPMRRWRAAYRGVLMETLEYARVLPGHACAREIPKYANARQAEVYEQMLGRGGSLVAGSLHRSKGGAGRVGFSQAARNFVSVFASEPPCVDALSLGPAPTSKIGWMAAPGLLGGSPALSLVAGSLYFWYWLVRGDGFDVTGWMMSDYLRGFASAQPEARELLEQLGHLLHLRRFEALQFKKNAGKFVGNFNYRGLASITRRSDLVAMACLGLSREHALEVLDYVERVLAINESAGERSIPPEVKAVFPAQQYDEDAQARVFSAADAFIRNHYGFTNEELDFIIKYHMGRDAGDGDD